MKIVDNLNVTDILHLAQHGFCKDLYGGDQG